MKTCKCGNQFEAPSDHPNQRLCPECLRRNHVLSVTKSRANNNPNQARGKIEKRNRTTQLVGDDGEIQNFIRHVLDVPPGGYQEKSPAYIRRAHPSVAWLYGGN